MFKKYKGFNFYVTLIVCVATLFILGVFIYVSRPKKVNAETFPIYWGALVKGNTYGLPEPPNDMRAVDVFESHTNKKVSILHFGGPWYINGVGQTFPSQQFEKVRLHGSIPLFSWSSRESSLSNTNQPNFRNSVITNGNYDAYIRQWAIDAKNWGHPFFLRFDWEMNGWWYPWAEGMVGTGNTVVNGNSPGDYARMWQHVHDIFNEVGATNVTWVWCINHISNTSAGTLAPVSQIFPGDTYVDWTSVDGYNRYSGWESFNTTFTGSGTTWLLNSYQALLNQSPTKPIMIAEFGSKEDLSNTQRKADWITDALANQIPNNFPQVKAIVYFNWNTTTAPTNPDATIAIESTPQSQAAFANGISSPYYATNTFSDLPPGPILPLSQPLPTSIPTPSATLTPTSVPTATPTPTTIPVNIIGNPSFEKTGSSWLTPWALSIKTGASGTIVQDSSTKTAGLYSAKITTTATGGTWYNVSLVQPALTFTLNKTYTITFWAKSSANRTTRVIIQQNYSPYTEYIKKVVNITTNWQKYSFNFISPVTDPNLKFSFSAADTTGTFWVDDVSIVTE